MKAMQLSTADRAKLLEMCQTLFPEYTDIIVMKLDVRLVTRWGKSMPNKEEYIPWFEFCIKHLIHKLNIGGIQSGVDLRILCCELPNPVAYLYHHFCTNRELCIKNIEE
jgi:hypothetical protein